MLRSKITKKDGLLYFDINGELYSPSAYMTYCPKKEYMDEFKKEGYKIFSFPVYVSEMGINAETGVRALLPNIYKAENTYNYNSVTKILEDLAPNGDKVFVFFRFMFQTPQWWDKENPDEQNRLYSGERVRNSQCSAKARETLWEVCRKFIDFIEESKWKNTIIGYQVAGGGTEEWPHIVRHSDDFCDYSENNRKYYAKWLENKYKNIAKLNKKHLKNYKNFDDVQLPVPGVLAYTKNGVLRDIKKECEAIDFYMYHSWVIVDTILYYAKKIKEYTDYKAITGTFYGYIWLFQKAYKGHNALNMLLESEYIDFVATTNSGQNAGGSYSFGAPIHSVMLHDKIFMVEGDIRTHLTPYIHETMPHAAPIGNDCFKSPVWAPLKNEFYSVSALKKAMGRTLCAGVGCWWFDMWSRFFSSDRMMKLMNLFKQAMDSRKQEGLKTEVAVIIDETSVYYAGLENGRKSYFCNRSSAYDVPVITFQREEIERMGCGYDVYEATDLANSDFDPDKYKLFIFVNMINPKEEVRKAIEQRIKKNGRTLLWTYFSDAYNNSKLTGFKTRYNKYDEYMTADYFGQKFPYLPLSCPRFTEEAIEDSYTVLNFEGTQTPCVLYKNCGDYQSFYSLLPTVPRKFLMEILNIAGVHIFSRDEDTIISGGEYLAIHALESGLKHIYLPENVTKVTEFEGKEFEFCDTHLFFNMEKHDTYLFKLDFE